MAKCITLYRKSTIFRTDLDQLVLATDTFSFLICINATMRSIIHKEEGGKYHFSCGRCFLLAGHVSDCFKKLNVDLPEDVVVKRISL